MINIVYDPESDLFIFMAQNTNEDPDVSNIDELLEAVSGELALFASCIAGRTKDAYYNLVNALEASGQDISIKKGIEELLETNEETVFLNGESKEKCLESITNTFKREIENLVGSMTEQEKNKEFSDEVQARLVSKFIDNMEKMFDVDTSHLFDNEQTEDTNEDYEDDLF